MGLSYDSLSPRAGPGFPERGFRCVIERVGFADYFFFFSFFLKYPLKRI